MKSKELIKILKKDKKASIVVSWKGVLYPIEDINFIYSNDGNSYISIIPVKDLND